MTASIQATSCVRDLRSRIHTSVECQWPGSKLTVGRSEKVCESGPNPRARVRYSLIILFLILHRRVVPARSLSSLGRECERSAFRFNQSPGTSGTLKNSFYPFVSRQMAAQLRASDYGGTTHSRIEHRQPSLLPRQTITIISREQSRLSRRTKCQGKRSWARARARTKDDLDGMQIFK